MLKSEPTVEKFMTYQPYTIEDNKTLMEAVHMMEHFHIHHLPVTIDGKLAGLISSRDIKLLMSFSDVSPDSIFLSDIYQKDVYQVEPDVPIHYVTDEMVSRHYDCALVVQKDQLVGIFTTTDVCRALSHIVQQKDEE